MNSDLSGQLQGFRIPPATAATSGSWIVARLRGVDFESLIHLPELELEGVLDARLAKMMVRVASALLGKGCCGRYGFIEPGELSLLLDPASVAKEWADMADLQARLVGLASATLTEELQTRALFDARLYGFPEPGLVVAYFAWRQQEAYLAGLHAYCRRVLTDKRPEDEEERERSEHVEPLLSELGTRDKREILLQNGIEYEDVPAWQRFGIGVSLDGEGVEVSTELARDAEYSTFVEGFLTVQ